MKNIVLLGVLVSLAAVATAFLLIRHRRASLTPRQTASFSNRKQSVPPTGVPDADLRDEELWEKTPEYKTMMDETGRIAKAGDAWDNLTSNDVELLIEYMHSPHYEARIQAVILTGGKYPAPVRSRLMPHVLGLLSDPVSGVRCWAATALGGMGDKSAIPFLNPLLNDHRPVVAKAAQRAISKLQENEAAPGK